MNIGVVTTSYPRTEGDHAGSFVGGHVAALRAAGHAVDVIGAHTIASPLFTRGGAPDELERGSLRTYVTAARFSAQLTREVVRRASAWDLIIAHWLAPSALAALVARGARRSPPILAIAHGGDIHTLRRLHLLAPALYALRARDVRLAFVSAELREVARAAAPRLSSWLDASIIQPMGIDVARFAALRATRETSPRTKVVVVARLVPVKGIDVAIRAMQHVTTDAEMVIAGDGPERARLEALAATCALDRLRTPLGSTARPGRAGPCESAALPRCPHTSFIGAVDSATRDRLLADAACVVIPSRVLPNGRSEGTPMIALEALAAGVPVIASGVGGLRELPAITRVPPEDPRALADAIERVLARRAQTWPGATGTHDAPMIELDWSVVSARLLGHVAAGGMAEPADRDPAATAATRKSSLCETGDTNERRTA